MQSWEKPIMETMAEEVTQTEGDVLEIGFGMGIAANEIMKNGCQTHTIIEAHPEIAELARNWADKQEIPVTVLEGLWQNVIDKIDETFDGILFDTYPLSEEMRERNH